MQGLKKAKDPGRRANLVLGIIMTITGIFLMVSLNNELEVIVLGGGVLLMIAGLLAILVIFVKELPVSATILGAAAVGLGAVLFTHDLIFQGIVASALHVASGLGVLALGILEILGVADLVRRVRKPPSKPTP